MSHRKPSYDTVRKDRRSDEVKSVPPVKSRIAAIDGRLRILTGKSKRPLIHLDQERPDAALATAIELHAAERILVLNCADGVVGIVVATVNPTAQVVLHDVNVAEANLAKRNVGLNASVIQNVSVATDEDIDRATQADHFDAIILSPDRSMSLDMIASSVALGRTAVRFPGGRFYLITHRRIGGLRHESMLRAEFGAETAVIERGRGGYLLVEAVRGTHEREDALPTLRRQISFEVLGFRFEVETEPSLFSKDDLDVGTRMLLENVDLSSFARALDIGCGWGAIGLVAATVNSNGRVVMMDVDTRAVQLALDNAKTLGLQDRAVAIATDDARDAPGRFDLILSNPPFHEDRATLVGLFAGASDKLTVGGRMYLVVEKTYVTKFEHIVVQSFGQRPDILDASGQFVIMALQR
jgi:16S rRNA (guanine1207-N2)-methyltransferase